MPMNKAENLWVALAAILLALALAAGATAASHSTNFSLVA